MKARKRINLSANQSRIIEEEIDRQIAQNMDKLSKNILSIVLWELHEVEGFGKKRLLRFHENFVPALKELQEFYDMKTDAETEWLCKKKLKEIGVDVEELSDVFNTRYTIS